MLITDANQRLEICKSCEFIKPYNRCGKCGCLMDVKVRFKNQKCPIDKWEVKMPKEKPIVNVVDAIDYNTTAEDNAMIGAMCSRSLKPFKSFMIDASANSGKFMSKFNVGYGHKSIADCGSFTIYIEGISLLAAKAVENSQLFNGQESSTRYLKFSAREFYDTGSEEATTICQNFLDFINDNYEGVVAHQSKLNPNLDDSDVKLLAIDIMRGFLPAGIKTNVAWHTTLSHAKETILYLLAHPLLEVVELGKLILDNCIAKYPSTFKAEKFVLTEYQTLIGANYTYADNDTHAHNENKITTLFHPHAFEDVEIHAAIFSQRAKFEKLPKTYDFYGDVRWDLMLDYGSFRDLQRHRNSDIYQPLLDQSLGFNDWYIQADQIGELTNKFTDFVTNQFKLIDKLEQSGALSPYDMQYVYPQGTNVSVSYRSNLNQMIYICELRSSVKVHPILRNAILDAIKQLELNLPFIDIKYDDGDLVKLRSLDTITGVD